jgi:hypothetical protein
MSRRRIEKSLELLSAARARLQALLPAPPKPAPTLCRLHDLPWKDCRDCAPARKLS